MPHALDFYNLRDAQKLVHHAIIADANPVRALGAGRFSEPCGNGSSASFCTSSTIRDTISRGILRRSFFVEVRHCRLKEAIALELGNELLVRNGRLLPALGYHGQIFQVFQ